MPSARPSLGQCGTSRGKSLARTPSAKRPTPALADWRSTKPALIITFGRCCNCWICWNNQHIRSLIDATRRSVTFVTCLILFCAISVKCLLVGQIIVLPAYQYIARSSIVWPNDTSMPWMPFVTNGRFSVTGRFPKSCAPPPCSQSAPPPCSQSAQSSKTGGTICGCENVGLLLKYNVFIAFYKANWTKLKRIVLQLSLSYGWQPVRFGDPTYSFE